MRKIKPKDYFSPIQCVFCCGTGKVASFDKQTIKCGPCEGTGKLSYSGNYSLWNIFKELEYENDKKKKQIEYDNSGNNKVLIILLLIFIGSLIGVALCCIIVAISIK